MNFYQMKSGYTTGSCATAGMKAALIALVYGKFIKYTTIKSPQLEDIIVPIKKVELIDETLAKAIVIKDAGDDPDITNGAEIHVSVKIIDNKGLFFKAGKGVGKVTKKGLALPIGEPAINPGPRKMMQLVYESFKDEIEGLEVCISVPSGEDLAKKTLNPTLGIVGGISIIGTTGIVKPMSEEGFKNSLIPQLKVIKEAGYEEVILVPGRIGHLVAKKLGYPAEQMAETSNFIGFMLEQAVRIGFRKILIIGHIGKLIKLSSGSFHTHNKMSDGRLETLAAYAGLFGASRYVIRQILEANTTEAVLPIISNNALFQVYDYAVKRAVIRAERYIHNEASINIVMSSLDGKVLANSKNKKKEDHV